MSKATKNAKAGEKPLALSIDLRSCNIWLNRELRNGDPSRTAPRPAALVDTGYVKTGEILAMVKSADLQPEQPSLTLQPAMNA